MYKVMALRRSPNTHTESRAQHCTPEMPALARQKRKSLRLVGQSGQTGGLQVQEEAFSNKRWIQIKEDTHLSTSPSVCAHTHTCTHVHTKQWFLKYTKDFPDSKNLLHFSYSKILLLIVNVFYVNLLLLISYMSNYVSLPLLLFQLLHLRYSLKSIN